MKISKWITMLLCCLAAVLFLPGKAYAAGMIDLERPVSLSMTYRAQGTPLTGASFSIYHVADVNAYGELSVTEDFAEYPVDIRGEKDEEWKELAAALEAFVSRDKPEAAATAKTDANGQVSFSTEKDQLVPGLYLVVGQRHEQDQFYYDAAPFMILLPGLDLDANDWNYDMTASLKYESAEIREKVSRRVLKAWNDKGANQDRPSAIEVQLLQDGRVADTVTLSEANSWSHTWKELDGDSRWTVTEKVVPEGYTVKLTREGTTFVLTNTGRSTSSGDADEDRLPQTGQLWWPVPVLVSAGLFLIVAGLLRRRRQ